MPKLVELLRQPRRAGFPAAFLQGRLAARRARWLESCLPGSGDEARQQLNRELDWLDQQLEPDLRRQLAPVLLYFELPALLAALRCREANDPDGAKASLEHSRWNWTLRETLTMEHPFPEILQDLAEILAPYCSTLAGLAKIRQELGRAGLEAAIWAGLLAAGRREQLNGPVGDFLARLAERQELLRLAKARHWPGKIAQPVVPRQLVRRYRENLADPGGLERRLLGEIARQWQHRRYSSRLDQLLDHLWTCFLATRDCGVRYLGALLGEEEVARETIL